VVQWIRVLRRLADTGMVFLSTGYQRQYGQDPGHARDASAVRNRRNGWPIDGHRNISSIWPASMKRGCYHVRKGLTNCYVSLFLNVYAMWDVELRLKIPLG
jgi:hypothetical protein